MLSTNETKMKMKNKKNKNKKPNSRVSDWMFTLHFAIICLCFTLRLVLLLIGLRMSIYILFFSECVSFLFSAAENRRKDRTGTPQSTVQKNNIIVQENNKEIYPPHYGFTQERNRVYVFLCFNLTSYFILSICLE